MTAVLPARVVDQQRVARVAIALLEDDETPVEAVLKELRDGEEDGAVTGVLFAALNFAVEVATSTVGAEEAAGILRSALLSIAAQDND